ncbi:hypothetical protein [Caballeronia mineralivorans]|uniref:hypothetical protein n=1 Tax=Caballeronia mineralivorans TaxID=2010198 RepID=UPI000B048F7A|nr:hypothetical protein [Caballeronia mineralivorans]
MKLDFYSKATLTVIAICLLVLTGRTFSIGPEVRASTLLTCNGQLKANSNGGTAKDIGGYLVSIQCNNN